MPDRPAVCRRVGPRRVASDAAARHGAARPGRARALREPAKPDRHLEWRRRGARTGTHARLRRRPGRFPSALRLGSRLRPADSRVRGNRPGAVHPHGCGRGHVRRQADRARALSTLAARRWRSGAGARVARARRASRNRDHPWPRRGRTSRRPGRSGPRALHTGAGGGVAARQLPAPLPRAVGAPRPAGVLPGGALPFAAGGALPQHVSGQHRHSELHRPPGPRRLSLDHRGDPARQPAAADLRPGLPGAVRIRLRARRQQRGRLHPAAEGQGRRALPRRGRLPETRDRARYRQAHRHRRFRPGRPHGGLLPAHLRSSRRDLRGAGEGRRDAALRHSGLSPAARPAGPGDRPDPCAGNPDPHRRRGRQPGGVPQGLRRRVSRARHAEVAPDQGRRCPATLRARRD